MKHLALVAAVMVALSSAGEAQQLDHVAVHPALTLWEDGNPHAGVAVTWRKNIWRNWGLNAGYILTKSLDHWQPHYDNIVWVGADDGSPRDSLMAEVFAGARIAERVRSARSHYEALGFEFFQLDGLGHVAAYEAVDQAAPLIRQALIRAGYR